jgi:hypothetical protein
MAKERECCDDGSEHVSDTTDTAVLCERETTESASHQHPFLHPIWCFLFFFLSSFLFLSR